MGPPALLRAGPQSCGTRPSFLSEAGAPAGAFLYKKTGCISWLKSRVNLCDLCLALLLKSSFPVWLEKSNVLCLVRNNIAEKKKEFFFLPLKKEINPSRFYVKALQWVRVSATKKYFFLYRADLFSRYAWLVALRLLE